MSFRSHGLDVININVYAKFYQNIPIGLELSTFFTNSQVTKSSQTVRWQNQMFDYRAHYESQPSVSVDFLRIVQSLLPVLFFNVRYVNDEFQIMFEELNILLSYSEVLLAVRQLKKWGQRRARFITKWCFQKWHKYIYDLYSPFFFFFCFFFQKNIWNRIFSW